MLETERLKAAFAKRPKLAPPPKLRPKSKGSTCIVPAADTAGSEKPTTHAPGVQPAAELKKEVPEPATAVVAAVGGGGAGMHSSVLLDHRVERMVFESAKHEAALAEKEAVRARSLEAPERTTRYYVITM